MRVALPLCVIAVALGCSSSGPEADAPVADGPLEGMPRIGMKEVTEGLAGPLERPLVVVLWRADMSEPAAAAFLAELNRFATRHEGDGLEVLALNVDDPAQVRGRALPLIAKVEPTFQARAFQGDRMGLGATVGWGGGELPVAALFGRAGRRAATGRGSDALAAVARSLPAVLAEFAEHPSGPR